MVNDQDNTNDEIGSIAHKDKANGQDNIKIMNSGNDTRVRDDEHGTSQGRRTVLMECKVCRNNFFKP